MSSITKRYMKDRSRVNPAYNPVKEGVCKGYLNDEVQETVEKIKSARRDGPIADELRRLCGGCTYFSDIFCECNKHENKCPKGLLQY